MERWEYNDVTFEYAHVKKPFEEWLNEYGRQGWELVDVHLFGFTIKQCIFKRKIQQVPDNSDSGDFRDNPSQFYDK